MRNRPLRVLIVGASVLLALAIAIVFVVQLSAIRAQRDAADLARRGERVTAAANGLEKLLLDLETGTRGYVITGRPAFLHSYESALRVYPSRSDVLLELTRDPEQRRRAREFRPAFDTYVLTWAEPTIRLASRDLPAARARVATGEGKRQVDSLRARFEVFARAETAILQRRAQRAAASERRSLAVAVVGIVGSLSLIALFAVYLLRLAVAPLSRLSNAARRLGRGELDARVDEKGPAEVAELARDFNRMADANARSFSELARRGAELEAVLESTTGGMTMTDRGGALVFSNKQMGRLWRELGVDAEGGIWERLAALAQLAGGIEQHAAAFAQLAADESFVYESPFDVPTLGRSFIGHTGPVQDASGAVTGRLFTLRETTAERAAETAKDQFVATVSHELRTPLTSIIGYIELIRDGDAGELTPEQDRFLGVVDRSAKQLHALVDDLLTSGLTASSTLELDVEDVALDDVVQESVDAAIVAAREKDITLTVEADTGLRLPGDRRRLVQLTTNLISNAIKFTPAGGTIAVRSRSADGRAAIEVEDSGIGIAADEQDRLFDRFFRASTARAAQVQGTGLGLAIVKLIVDAHRGTIEVRSREGTGTTFTVEFPMEGGR